MSMMLFECSYGDIVEVFYCGNWTYAARVGPEIDGWPAVTWLGIAYVRLPPGTAVRSSAERPWWL